MLRQRWTVRGGEVLGLLLMVAVGCIDEAAAVEAINKLGGGVKVDEEKPGKPVVSVDLHRTEVTDAGAEEIEGTQELADAIPQLKPGSRMRG